MAKLRFTNWIIKWLPGLLGLLVLWLLVPWWCARDAGAWYRGEQAQQRALAEELVSFEARDDIARSRHAAAKGAADPKATEPRTGAWALVTHQMTALGLSQIMLAHPSLQERYLTTAANAAEKSLLPEMRDFGTKAWNGEDALAALGSAHGHAYLSYSALALSQVRALGAELPAPLLKQHDALIAAYERRLLAAPLGLIETYPGEAYPTDVAAVAAAIAVHGRATGVDHSRVLAHWARSVREHHIDRLSGLVHQRMGATTGKPHDAPRGSGTGLAAYYAGFADRALAQELTAALLAHLSTFAGFGGLREYASGHTGAGDIDSGPVLLGVSVAATGFALAPMRAFGHEQAFVALYRTTDLFGLPVGHGERTHFAIGGAVGNALLLAFLTSGPELAP